MATRKTAAKTAKTAKTATKTARTTKASKAAKVDDAQALQKVKTFSHDLLLAGMDRVHLIEPLQYQPFVNLMARSYLIITDSGGMQEEAPSLGKPVLVVRRETERPEAVEAGTVKLAGVEEETIYGMAKELLSNQESYNKMAFAVNPYGDGRAAERIVDLLSQRKL